MASRHLRPSSRSLATALASVHGIDHDGIIRSRLWPRATPPLARRRRPPCAACHGQDGATGLDPTYPNLAGQNEKYLTASADRDPRW